MATNGAIKSTLSPEKYIDCLNKCIEMQKKLSCIPYVEALPIAKQEKAKLYEQVVKVVRNGIGPKENPFS